MITNNILEIDKIEMCVSEIKIELADLLGRSKKNNVWIKRVAEKSQKNNLPIYLIPKTNDLRSNMNLMDKDIEHINWFYSSRNTQNLRDILICELRYERSHCKNGWRLKRLSGAVFFQAIDVITLQQKKKRNSSY